MAILFLRMDKIQEIIQAWVYDLLVYMGLISETSSYLDNLVIFFLLLLITLGIDYLCRHVFLEMFKRLARKTKTRLDDLIVERRIIHKLMHIVPAVLLYILLPLAFPPAEMPGLLTAFRKLCLVYIIAVSMRFIIASLRLLHAYYNQRDVFKNKPLKGFIQVLQVVVYFIGGILIISVLINKSAGSLLAGLGASAAVLMLVFKDTILGFVAGIQLSANDMLRVGDWITMEKYGANGFVMEVTLNAVKVRNFDHTITTIPPYALVSDSFQNWRGMSDSEGRRIKRSISIDMNSVRFCTPDMLARFKEIPLLTDYIEKGEPEPASAGRRSTNLGIFRAYLMRYLRSLPAVSRDLVCMVRYLQPTENGLPIELYCFSSRKDWMDYEEIQADIFDHVLAVLPEFGLRVFQNVSGADLRSLKYPAPEEIKRNEC